MHDETRKSIEIRCQITSNHISLIMISKDDQYYCAILYNNLEFLYIEWFKENIEVPTIHCTIF